MTEAARQAAADLDGSQALRGQPVLDRLVALLDLERIEENIFRGVSPAHSNVRVFGTHSKSPPVADSCTATETTKSVWS